MFTTYSESPMATATAPTTSTATDATTPAAIGLDAELTALRLKAETQLATLARESATSGEEPPLSAIAKLANAAGLGTDAAVARFRKMVAAVHEHAVELESVAAAERAMAEMLRPYGGDRAKLCQTVEDLREKYAAAHEVLHRIDNAVTFSLGYARARVERIAETYPQLFPS